MAAIDALLRALLRHQMDCLVLVPGRRPLLRQADREHPVTKTTLDADTLAQLLAEIAPPGSELRPGAEVGFDYALEGTSFRFTGGAAGDGWSVEAAAGAGAAAAAAPVEPAAAPAAPATQPSASAPRPITAVPDLLAILVDRGASDLHLTVGQRPRIRHDGELEELPDLEPPSADHLEQLLREITPEHQRELFDETSDTDFAYELPGRARFRVNLFRNRNGAAAVFRQIPHEILTFEQLGLPEHLRRLTELSKGLVLVTGPTGSGKSTTLAALIDQVNKTRRDHIITIEDPIEFVHPSQGLPGQPARGRACTRARSSAPCAPPCARTRTSSWSARCATSRPSPSPSRPPRPAIWSSAPCTPPPPPPPSSGSSTSSPATARSRSASCSPRACGR